MRADLAHLLVRPADVGAELVKTDRGGDITYHGPGQLVGYPILNLATPSTPEYVRSVEQLLIDALADLGLPGAGREPEYPGVWVNGRKIAAIGVRLTRGRTMHGFALNVDPDMAYFEHIVPCGISDREVTSLAREGVDVSMHDVVDAVVRRATDRWGPDVERQDVVWWHTPDDLSAFSREGSETSGTTVRLRRRLDAAGVEGGLAVRERKPEWLRVPARMGEEYRALRRTLRQASLVTVCEEAGCPNIYECWADGTATFMINGERCTRACGFCLVDTRHPEALDATEPERVADAVAEMGLAFAVVTAVARDDLPDGGAEAFAATIRAIRARRPGTSVEVLIPDCQGDPDALDVIFSARPDVLNHNVETVPRLQRAVRPSASYARSLAVLSRAKAEGLVTKSGLIVGMGETEDEIVATLADLAAIGVDIVTIGQYLRPTARHLPVARWWEPEAFARWASAGEARGIPHVEASPLTRSSYHAKSAAEGVTWAAPTTVSTTS